jgi:hypothetical protein
MRRWVLLLGGYHAPERGSTDTTIICAATSLITGISRALIQLLRVREGLGSRESADGS